MAPDTKTLTRRFFQEADRGRTPLELLTSDFTACFTGLPPMDRDGYDQFEATVRSAFPDIHHHVEDLVAEDDTVAVRLRLEGTHTGAFMGVPASDAPIAVEGTAFLRVADGKITQFWGFLDQLGLMQQIGGLPAPEEAH